MGQIYQNTTNCIRRRCFVDPNYYYPSQTPSSHRCEKKHFAYPSPVRCPTWLIMNVLYHAMRRAGSMPAHPRLPIGTVNASGTRYTFGILAPARHESPRAVLIDARGRPLFYYIRFCSDDIFSAFTLCLGLLGHLTMRILCSNAILLAHTVRTFSLLLRL